MALTIGSKKVLVSYGGRRWVGLSYYGCIQRTYIMHKIDSRGFVHSTKNKTHNLIPNAVWNFLDRPTLDEALVLYIGLIERLERRF